MSVLQFLFGCRHKNLSFPMTLKRTSGMRVAKETRRSCLICGREFLYDFDKMRIVEPKKRLQVVEQKRSAPVVEMASERKVRIR